MKNDDQYKKPVGYIGLILHKGGEWNSETQSLTSDAEIIDQIEFKNTIVASASYLMAQRMAPGSAINSNVGNFIASGLQYLSVGTIVADPINNPGDLNVMSPPLATGTESKLKYEIFRKQFTSWTFVDPSTNAASNTATNILQIVTTFQENEAVGALTEMGIFGGNATTVKDSGIMFNYKTFAVWNKPSDARLTVTWKLTF
ncbi:hypothetical protein D3C87_78180 [compost metagenome]